MIKTVSNDNTVCRPSIMGKSNNVLSGAKNILVSYWKVQNKKKLTFNNPPWKCPKFRTFDFTIFDKVAFSQRLTFLAQFFEPKNSPFSRQKELFSQLSYLSVVEKNCQGNEPNLQCSATNSDLRYGLIFCASKYMTIMVYV